ncbi:hypothetical protein F2P45_18310 [Massilia sp. CCM 8733]|uniref:Uncharacterized protein n=1 Tax=Massilia mucilaginosa TaxID=2609282 RepID=A0ABX0NX16_9BURK|nr:hypothetical protein [Massilia mucilaginosa]NHZ90957.1 hypothetical protein [Massilia mucilaginosa]
MPYFDLRLGFAPSFERGGAIRVEGDVTGMATFEADPTGFLPGLVCTLPVDAGGMAAIHASCSAMLAGWDDNWSQEGCDGISFGGTFAPSGALPQHFSLWSPERASLPHAMISAVFNCFPPERCSGVAEEQLESIRSYFQLQPPLTLYDEVPLRLRLAPSAHRVDANEIETRVRALPDHVDVIVDLSGLEAIQRAMAQLFPVNLLLQRRHAVHWRVRSNAVDVLVKLGVDPSMIVSIERAQFSDAGYPVVLGCVVRSPDMFSLAQSSERVALVSAFRSQFCMTYADAARAAVELIGFMKTHRRQSLGFGEPVPDSLRLPLNLDTQGK